MASISCKSESVSPSFFSYNVCHCCVLLRGGQVMWHRAVSTPETKPRLLSLHTSTMTNSGASRHMHVSNNLSAFLHFVFHFHHVHFQHARVFLHTDFINLLDNYEVSTGVSETVTSEELQENRLFINAIMETDVMKVQYSCERTDNMVICSAAVCTAC